MLLLVSSVLKRFLEDSVAPPFPDIQPSDWVRISDLSREAFERHTHCVLLSLLEIEPDKYLRNAPPVPTTIGSGPTPLPLELLYLVTCVSASQADTLRALDGVLRAFHSEPTITVADYLDPAELAGARATGSLAETLRVALVPPDLERLGTIRTGMEHFQLALYYRVQAAMVVPFAGDPVTPPVERVVRGQLDARVPKEGRPE